MSDRPMIGRAAGPRSAARRALTAACGGVALFALAGCVTSQLSGDPARPLPSPDGDIPAPYRAFGVQAGTAAVSTAAAPRTGADLSANALYRQICLAPGRDPAAQRAAAVATGAFDAPDVRDSLGGDLYTFRSPDGQIEAKIASGGPIGESCAVGEFGGQIFIQTEDGTSVLTM